MSLKFIIGSSGSGKSTFIYKRLIEESMRDMRQQFLVIVPEQFTLETQRRLVSLHPAHSVVNIDILSFDRLAYRVFDELCESGLQLLDDTGKNLILRRVAEEVSDDLLVLKKKIKSPGYIDQVKSLLSEFEQYNIDGEGIQALADAEGASPAFKNKIHDISIIRERYMEYISGDHVTAEQRYERLAELLPDSSLVRDAVVVLDGYTGFTPIQNLVLEQIVSLSSDVYVTVTMDVRENIFGGGEHELFSMSKKMIRSLSDIAKKMQVELSDPIMIEGGEKTRFIPGGRLEFLEKNIFAGQRKGAKADAYSGESRDEIRIFSLDDPKEELRFVASMIRRMVAFGIEKEEPLKYSDFAIVSGATETYSPYIDEVFSEYDIPVFADENTRLLYTPCLEFLLSALSILNYDLKYDDVVAFLRTGLCNVSVQETDLFDQFLYRTGIRGRKKYGSTFAVRPAEFTDDELTLINDIRKGIFESFAPLFSVFSKVGDVSEKTKALRDFFAHYDIENKLNEKDEEYAAVYGSVMELLDRVDALLPGIETDGREFCDILSAGLDAITLGTIPQDYDRVLFGDVERTRLSGIKKLFLIGANDGVIPSETASPNILSQNERMVLFDAGFELAPTLRERSFMQRFYLYQLLTKGSEGLYITFADRAFDGSSLRESYIVGQIKKLFSDLRTEPCERSLHPELWISTPADMKRTFIMLLRQFIDMKGLTGKRAALFSTLLTRLKNEDAQSLERIMGAAFFKHEDETIPRAVMRAINGNELHVSVSRVERYAACAYAYFLNYGLKLKERREHEFEYNDMGTLYHEALKNYSDLIHKDKKSWRDVTAPEQNDYLNRAVTMAYDAVARTEIMETNRERYILESMKKTLKKTVWAIHRQVEKGEFEPSQFEVQLKDIGSMAALTYELSDESRMVLSGQIDRIDTCESRDRILVKIVDYKSGGKALDYLSMYYGLQIQLVFYMNAATEGMQEKTPDKRIVPAAFFYYHIDDPMIEADAAIGDEELNKKQIEKLKPTGSIRDDAGVISALDGSAGEAIAKHEAYKSEVAKIELKKGGELSAKSETVSETDMEVMRDHVRQTVRHVGEDIIDGRIDLNPYRNGNKNACTYCPYSAVCGFDPGLPGYEYHVLPPMGKKEDILAAMKEETNHE